VLIATQVAADIAKCGNSSQLGIKLAMWKLEQGVEAKLIEPNFPMNSSQ